MEPVELIISKQPEPYTEAVSFMERRVADIRNGLAPETLWLLQHPSLYTAGTSADPCELVDPSRFPTFKAGRGGRYTYHGPGQRVAYVMMDLGLRGNDVRAFVDDLEEWLIATLARFDIRGERRGDRVGIWIEKAGENTSRGENKIAALGIRVRRWVTFHGVSINVDVNLDHFRGIVPCGISDAGVTSLQELGLDVTIGEVDLALISSFERVFGRSLEILV